MNTKEISIGFDTSFDFLPMEHRTQKKKLGVYKLKLLEVKAEKISNFNTVSLIFTDKNDKKYFLDRLFLDVETFGGSINYSYDLNHQLIAQLGVPNSFEMITGETYNANVLEETIRKNIGVEVYLALSIRLDVGFDGLFYDYRLIQSFNIKGQSLREIKYNNTTLRDLYHRSDLLTTLYSNRYLKTGKRIQLEKDFSDMNELIKK